MRPATLIAAVLVLGLTDGVSAQQPLASLEPPRVVVSGAVVGAAVGIAGGALAGAIIGAVAGSHDSIYIIQECVRLDVLFGCQQSRPVHRRVKVSDPNSTVLGAVIGGVAGGVIGYLVGRRIKKVEVPLLGAPLAVDLGSLSRGSLAFRIPLPP